MDKKAELYPNFELRRKIMGWSLLIGMILNVVLFLLGFTFGWWSGPCSAIFTMFSGIDRLLGEGGLSRVIKRLLIHLYAFYLILRTGGGRNSKYKITDIIYIITCIADLFLMRLNGGVVKKYGGYEISTFDLWFATAFDILAIAFMLNYFFGGYVKNGSMYDHSFKGILRR